jgi:hypothetical protein
MGQRSSPPNGYGRCEIEDVPVVEEPMRLIQQLCGIARGVLALGLPATAAAAIARRVALDSMPAARHAVLKALSTGEVLTTAGCARAAHPDRKVARMALEELAAIAVVENDRDGEEDDPVGAVNWRLKGDDGKSWLPYSRRTVTAVGGGTKRGYIRPLLPKKEKKQPIARGSTHTSSHL